TPALDADDEIARLRTEEFELPPHHAALRRRERELIATIMASASGSPLKRSMKDNHLISLSGSEPGLTRPKSSKSAAAWRTGIVAVSSCWWRAAMPVRPAFSRATSCAALSRS